MPQIHRVPLKMMIMIRVGQIQTKQPLNSQWTLPSCLQQSVVNTFTGGPRGKNKSETPHISDSCTTLRVFMYVAEIGTMFVVKTNRYYHCCMGSLDDGYSPQPDVTEAEMFVFLAITIQMRYWLWDQMTYYWAEVDQFYTAFYSNMRWNRYSDIQEWGWRNGGKLRQTMGNTRCVWNYKQDIF